MILGWLSAKPDGWPKTRRETMTAQGKDLGLPAIEARSYLGGYMIEALMDAGPMMPGAMDLLPLSWSEIRAFADATGLISEPEEIVALRTMSAAFLRGFKAGADGLSKHPATWG